MSVNKKNVLVYSANGDYVAKTGLMWSLRI